MALQTFTLAPTGGSTTGLSIHFTDGRVVHYKNADISKIKFDGTFTGDGVVPTGDAALTNNVKDGSEQ